MTRTSAQIPIIVCASPQQTTEPFIWRLFKDEDELRRLWGNPETRRTLLTALEERGFGKEALKDIRAMVANDKSDLFDVLAYIAFARPTMTRQERADAQKEHILAACDDKLRSFIDFVLGQYVTCGIEELDQNKLPDLLRLKYGGIPDATRQLNAPILSIQNAFTQFQPLLFKASEETSERAHVV